MNDNTDTDLYMFVPEDEKIDVYLSKKRIRGDVKEIIFPCVEKFIKNRITYSTFNDTKYQDSVGFLHFFFKVSVKGKNIIKLIKNELPEHFSTSDVIDTFYRFIYKMHIDVLSIEIVELKQNDSQYRQSLWDKISEKGHV